MERVRVQPSRKLKLDRGKALIQRSSCDAFGFLDSGAFNHCVHEDLAQAGRNDQLQHNNALSFSQNCLQRLLRFKDSRTRGVKQSTMVRDVRSLLIVQILEDPRFISLHYRMCGWKKNHIEIGSEKLTRLKLQLQLGTNLPLSLFRFLLLLLQLSVSF